MISAASGLLRYSKVKPKQSIFMSGQLCPLCQQANLCKAGTTEQNQCWCMQQQFQAELLAKATDQSSCICADCLARYIQQDEQVQQFNPT
jgi:hypothetical protein